MQDAEILSWLEQGDERQRVLLALTQPLTGDQVATRLENARAGVSHHLRQLHVYGVVEPLNAASHQSRLYWVTEQGIRCQDQVAQRLAGGIVRWCPRMNWDRYGWLCFRHRSAIVLAMDGALQPPVIKRRARWLNPELRMSSTNCRDVVHLLRARGIVRAVRVRGKHHLRYELTEVGRTCQELLRRAATPVAVASWKASHDS